MKKISIKREQSQAGLSFAEREKFRPQVKNKLLLLLVLLAAVVSGAWAQDPAKYKITVAEGTEDADKWTISPNPAEEGSPVTATYNGAKKVKSVKAVKKGGAEPASLIVTPVVGQIIGSDGKNYDANATLPDGVTALAVIAYVGSETGDDTYKNGLAIALADEFSGARKWSIAKSTCEGKTATVTGAKWCLPSQDQWKQMFKANGGNDARYTGLNTTITNAGGTNLRDDGYSYWSSSEYQKGASAYYVSPSHGEAAWSYDSESYGTNLVRACLAF